MTNVAALASRHAGRPVLMTPRAAEEVAHRLRDIDARAFERPSRIGALIRKLAGGRGRPDANGVRPLAMEDDDGPPPVPFDQRAAYAPLYAGDPEDLGYCWSLIQGVALMQCDTPLLEKGEDVCGVVYHGYDTLLEAMRQASADSRVKAIFLRLSSPGGVVAGGLADLAAFMRQARASAGGKPIWVFADMACSAAYWIAAQADRIVAPKVGLVGSIGAVLVHEDWTGALEQAGVKVEAIQFGTSKTDGAWWAALSPTARADLQAEIDQCGRNFVADVVAGRPQLTAEALIATQARVFMAEHDEAERSGLAIGFVDAIQGEAEAFADLVRQVSSPEVPTLSPPAVGGRTATAPEKDKPMADKALTTPGPEATAPNGDDTATETTVATESGATVAGGDAEDAIEASAESVAQAIANSPEGKANPAAAVKAIAAGLTLAQFKAMADGEKPAGQLAVVLAGAPRLGPDGQVAAKAPLSASETYQRNTAKGLEARRKR